MSKNEPIHCPKCQTTDISTKVVTIDAASGKRLSLPVTAVGGIFIAIGVILGVLSVISAITSSPAQDPSPTAIVVLGLMMVLLFAGPGLYLAAPYVQADRRQLSEYHCKQCRHEWHRMEGAEITLLKVWVPGSLGSMVPSLVELAPNWLRVKGIDKTLHILKDHAARQIEFTGRKHTGKTAAGDINGYPLVTFNSAQGRLKHVAVQPESYQQLCAWVPSAAGTEHKPLAVTAHPSVIDTFRVEEQAALCLPDLREAVQTLKALYTAKMAAPGQMGIRALNAVEGKKDATTYILAYLDERGTGQLDDVNSLEPFRRSIAHSRNYSHEDVHRAKLEILEWAYQRITQSASAPRSISSSTPKPQEASGGLICATCSAAIRNFHYSFEHIVISAGVGWQCSGCGTAYCNDHLDEQAKDSEKCPNCGGTLIRLEQGPAASSMIESARQRGFYNEYIRPPESQRTVVKA
ncbi:MAG: hypothetical protein KF716_15930 [Anaerolineae bacterium]|nr:hypothetical protein [Anaerolineae bacterium]